MRRQLSHLCWQRGELEAILGHDYARQPGFRQWARFLAAVALTSWIGSGVKNLESAWSGETLLGTRLEGTDRVLLGTVGAIEAVLVALPIAKGVTAAGKAAGLGKVGGTAVIRMMAVDITSVLGRATATKLLQTNVGKMFIRAYAKVYTKGYIRLFRKRIEERIQELVKNYTGKLSKELYETKVRTIFHSRIQGKISEKVFKQLLGGSQRTYTVTIGGQPKKRRYCQMLCSEKFFKRRIPAGFRL